MQGRVSSETVYAAHYTSHYTPSHSTSLFAHYTPQRQYMFVCVAWPVLLLNFPALVPFWGDKEPVVTTSETDWAADWKLQRCSAKQKR
eukprot:354575-Chlamydomonas_euryale.AAC.10